MSVFVISDLHLSFGTDKPMDVFGARWQNFEERLETNWKQNIRDGDTVVLPGDLSWGMTVEEAREDFRFLNDLPGKKILMKGNHEYYWNTVSKLETFCQSEGFDTISFLHNNAFVAENLILAGSRGWELDASLSAADQKILDREVGRFSLSLAAAKKLQESNPENEIVVFSHYPLSSWSCRHPALDLFCAYGVRRTYYGHLHMLPPEKLPPLEEGGVTFTLVAADHLNFNPLKIN